MGAAAPIEQNVADLLRPRESGRIVNPTVVMAVKQPQPDYAAMQALIAGKLPGSPDAEQEA